MEIKKKSIGTKSGESATFIYSTCSMLSGVMFVDIDSTPSFPPLNTHFLLTHCFTFTNIPRVSVAILPN
ncbi:hypothetical protein C0J52_01611 [Blattella germanica]|nr:hypothetical protein C0J52_01611 [Blattella germanica]